MPAPSPVQEEVSELRLKCEELERQLHQDALTFENQTLEMQLEQMRIDYKSLQDDKVSMGEIFTQKISEMTTQLEEARRAADTASGHADCLSDLFHFHEDQGHLAGSYWRAQCEKRDDSIKFLTLKLQEYTVPWPEYEAARSPVGRSLPIEVPANSREAFQKLKEQHSELCREVAFQQEQRAAIEREVEAVKLQCAALQAARESWLETAMPPTDAWNISSLSSEAQRLREVGLSQLEQEAARLREDVTRCESLLTSAREIEVLPTWAHRCPWRDELDVRAGQLERISLQFDATKRLLDAANEELQWQAMSAQAVRDRLAQAERTTAAEEARVTELEDEHRHALAALEALLRRWPVEDTGVSRRPAVYHQARALLEAQKDGAVAVTPSDSALLR